MSAPTPSADKCPSCGAPLSADAVLCVDCGFDRRTGIHIATAIDDDGASAEVTAARRRSGDSFDPLADNADTALAGRIARDSSAMLALCVLTICFLQILTPFLAVWSLVRLVQWYGLRDRCEELREPNSLSPHYEVAMKFNACHIRLWISLVVFMSIAVFFTLRIISGLAH
jgi:hypothetical protein